MGDGTTGTGGFLTGTGDTRNTEPLLGPLANNGGPAQTHLLLVNSPAVDRGLSFGMTLDQRGLSRIADSAYFPNAGGGDGTDIGALEVHPFGSTTDTDGDGTADEWESFYGLGDPNGDPDNDGRTNRQEFAEGTNPQDSSSYQLRVIAIQTSGNNVEITFNGVANRTVRLERNASLIDPDWNNTGIQVTPPATGKDHPHRRSLRFQRFLPPATSALRRALSPWILDGPDLCQSIFTNHIPCRWNEKNDHSADPK